MRAEGLKWGLVSIPLVFALALSITLLATPVLAEEVHIEPGGTTKKVLPGDNFTLSFRLEWNEPDPGYFAITLKWVCPENDPAENFTIVGVSAYFDNGQTINAAVTSETESPFDNGTLYIKVVGTPAGDPNNDNFNVDITILAGSESYAHIPGTHNIEIDGSILVAEALPFVDHYPPDPVITIRVLARGVAVEISPSEDSGPPGETLSYSITVTNTGDLLDNYTLTANDNENWGLSLDNTHFEDIENGGSRSTTLRVTIPENASLGAEDNITVTVTGTGVENSASCTAHAVILLRDVESAISPSYQRGSPGSVLEYTVTVSNTGNVEDNYELTKSDEENWGLTVSPELLTVPGGKNRTATLSVTIPSDVVLGTEDNITVTATSWENAEISASDTCVAYAARVIYPIYDAYVWHAEHGTSHNTDNLKIGIEEDYLIWAWLRFDLSDIPFGHRVENARLWLYFHDSFNGGSPGGIAAYFSDNDSWTEDTITWDNQPSFSEAVRDDIPQFSDIGWKSLTLTQDVGRELDGDEKISWCLKSPENVLWGDNRNIAHSKDYENALYRPYLEIIHVPVYRMSISISPPEDSARPGENVTFTVTVKNMGAFEDNYDLEVSDNENWGLTVPPTLLTVPSGENRAATLNVTIPENAVPCTRDNITVTATSQGDNTVKDNASCIAHAAIAPPKLLTPSDGTLTGNTTPSFRWENTSVADNYEIWVDNDPDFLLLMSGFPDNTAENFYVIEAPGLADENYSWKVRAYLGADVSDFSEVWTFLIDTTPPAEPTLAWPVDGANISDNAPNLDWEDVEENTLPVLYQVFISDNSEFPYENRTSPWVENDNWIVSPALPEGVWYWRVCAKDNAGNVGENSPQRSFHVDITPPGKPMLNSPGNDTTEEILTVTFNWSSVTDIPAPVTYHIQIDNEASFTSPYVHEKTGLTENSYNYTFSVDGNYYWWVRARDNAGNYGEWADNFKLTIETISRGVGLSISPPDNSGPPGGNVTFTVTVTNVGDVEDTYTLSATSGEGWSVSIEPTLLTIAAGASDNATLSVVVPPDASDDDSDIIGIKALSTGDPEVDDFEDAYVQVTVQRGVNVLISDPKNSGPPGENVTFTVTVINTGNVVDSYDLMVKDSTGWGPTLSENLLEDVQPDENKTATLSVTIPENVSADAEDKITVTATSTKDTEVSASASCIATVTVVRGVEVSISPENQKGPPKGKLEYTITIVNKGNIEDNYSLTVSDNENWGPTISPTSLTIPSNDSRTAKLNVTIPEDAENGTKDNVTVTATSHGDNTVKDNASCTAQAFIVRGVGVSIDPSHSSDVPGATLSYTVTVTNTGNVADSYDLTISDDAVPSWNPTVSRTSLTIAAGGSDTATLSVTIPSDAEHGERDDIQVVAASMEVSASASCEAEASILRRVEVSISPGSGSGEPGTSLTYSVTVRNTGLMDDTYTLRAVGKEGWSVSIEPDSLTIAAGASDNATLRVVISPDAPVGDSMTTYVNVQSGEDSTVISTDTCRTVVTGVPEGPELELPVPLAISVVLIGAAIIVPAYLLRGRRKKAARRRVLSFSA